MRSGRHVKCPAGEGPKANSGMLFTIYEANHGSRDGIIDYIAILTEVLTRRGHEVVVSRSFCNRGINLVIDEFTSIRSNHDLKVFKSANPGAVVVIVLTEFIEKRWFVRSFNFFGGLLDAAVIASMNVYFRMQRRDFRRSTARDWCTALLFAPLLPIHYVVGLLAEASKRQRRSLTGRLHRLAYWLMRYQGLEAMAPYADAAILSHPMIERNLQSIAPTLPVFGTICPEIDLGKVTRTVCVGKALGIEITGSITSYRQRIIKKLDTCIVLSGLNRVFGRCEVIPFGQGVGDRRCAYSLHPPQTKKWRYSSPTRIYGAYTRDHNIPVLTRNFCQHPIEKAAFVFRGPETLIEMHSYFYDRPRLLEEIRRRIDDYNVAARVANDAIVEALVSIASEGGNKTCGFRVAPIE